MTNSRSIASTSKLAAIAVAVAAVLAAGRVAEAGRKRVVVLDFDGPRGDKFHDDLVRLIKKTHTVVPADKWTGAADQLGAGTLSGKDVKKVARKLKIDAIVEGKIEKRRDEFIIRLKLHGGKSGELVGDSIDTKAEGPRLDGRAQKDLRDELVSAIDDIESNHDGAGGDDDAKDDDDKPAAKKPGKPAAKSAQADDDDDDDKPAAKKPGKKPAHKDEDDDAGDDRAARRSKFAGRVDDERGTDKVGKGKKAETDDDDRPAAKKPGKPAGKPADADDDDKPAAKKPVGKPADDDKPVAKKPAGKPADDPRVAAKDPAKKPAGKPADDDELPPKKSAGKPAAGNTARRADSKKVATRDDDDATEVEAEDKVAPLGAAAALAPGQRFLDAAIGLSMTMRQLTFAFKPTLRATPSGYKGVPAPGALFDVAVYPLAFGHTRRDVVKDLGLEVVYDRVIKLNSQVKSADGMTTTTYSTQESRFALTAVYRHAFDSSAGAPVFLGTFGYQRQQFNIKGNIDLPDVKYSIFAPGVGVRYPVIPKLTLGADVKLLLITDTGRIQEPNEYGAASVLGFDGSIGADYLVTPNIFVRAGFRYEAISFSFKGGASQTNARDGDPTSQDVTGAHDSYIGGLLTVGYVY